MRHNPPLFYALPEYGINPPLLETYSSTGGTPILFGVDGSPLSVPEVRLKPEFTAVDGVNTTFFFNHSHGDDGIDDFFGTSAAAPHAAGVAALMLQKEPSATPSQINAVLGSTAIDILGAGFDHDSGYGLIQADAAIAALTIPVNQVPTADAGPDQTVADTNGIGGESVTLDGSGSSDSDGSNASYAWSWTGGSASGVNPTVNPC